MTESQYPQGGVAELRISILNNISGQPVDATSISVRILNGSTPVAGPYTNITRELQGVYSYNWNIPNNLPLDEYTAEWTTVVNGVQRIGREFFDVVDPYDLEAGPLSTTLADLDDLKQFPALAALDTERVQGALLAASALVRAYCRPGKPDGWLNPNGTLQQVPAEVKQATVFIARRVAFMPDSGASDETAGPFSVKRDSSMWVSSAEQALLDRWSKPRRFITGGSQGPVGRAGLGNVWVSDGWGGDLIDFPIEGN